MCFDEVEKSVFSKWVLRISRLRYATLEMTIQNPQQHSHGNGFFADTRGRVSLRSSVILRSAATKNPLLRGGSFDSLRSLRMTVISSINWDLGKWKEGEAGLVYQRIRTIKRTVFQGVAWWQEDIQALPPRGWCVRCGAEVFRPGRELCRRCQKEKNRRSCK